MRDSRHPVPARPSKHTWSIRAQARRIVAIGVASGILICAGLFVLESRLRGTEAEIDRVRARHESHFAADRAFAALRALALSDVGRPGGSPANGDSAIAMRRHLEGVFENCVDHADHAHTLLEEHQLALAGRGETQSSPLAEVIARLGIQSERLVELKAAGDFEGAHAHYLAQLAPALDEAHHLVHHLVEADQQKLAELDVTAASARRDLRSCIIAAGLLVSVGFGLGTFYLSRSIIRPLEEVCDAMTACERGGRIEELRPTRCREIDELARRFRSMASRIEVREAHLAQLIDSEPQCVKTVAADGTLLDMNRAGLALIEADDLASAVGANVFDLVHPDHRAEFQAMHGAVIAGESGSLVFRIVGLRGAERWMETHAVPLRNLDGEIVHLAITHDISRQVQQDAELQTSQERLDLALRGSSDGLWDRDLRTDEVWFSPMLARVLDLEDGQFDGAVERWQQCIHPDDRRRADRALLEHLERQEPFDVQYRLCQSDATYRWFRVKGRAQRDEAGNAFRMSGSITDIEEIKAAEQALAEARDRAEEASVAKTAFLANMSHEIRTPMTAILGFADLLTTPGLRTEERDSHIATIRRNGEHLLSIINDILDISKIEAGRMSIDAVPCSTVDVIEDVVALMDVRARGRGIDLAVDYAERIPAVTRTDPLRLRQILVNLIGNAIKFTELGSVRVQVAGHEGADGRGRLEIRIVDTGIGIPKEKIGELFDAFSQADDSMTRRFGGTGLGLHISNRLAEMLGGNVVVESDAGRGSTFTVTLDAGPIGDCEMVLSQDITGRARAVEEIPAMERDKPLAGCRVLLAEDGPDNQRLLGFILRRAGASVEIVGDGAEAVERVGAEQDGIDLILMDMQMPVLDGYEATRRLRAAGCSVPIIALTAHAMTGDRERCVEAGCDDYVSKPIDRPALLALCAEWFGRAAGTRAA